MIPVKVNILISHAPEDKPAAEKLMQWLYPMRDEVNVWHYDPPPPAPAMPPSWRILLPWFRPDDPRKSYAKTLKHRRENAHIYIFLTSYKSLCCPHVEEDSALAVSRRIDCVWDDLVPLVLPIHLSPSRWQEESKLAHFTPLLDGLPLSAFPVEEDAYLEATEKIAALAKTMQVRLNEAKYYRYHPEVQQKKELTLTTQHYPYLGEFPDLFEYKPPPVFNLPDWLGWSLIALILTVSVGAYRNIHPAESKLHLKARPDFEYQPEYPRQPLVPPPTAEKPIFPAIED